MAWVKIDTSYLRHPKLIELHPQAQRLHLASILWTAEHLTDGWVPHRALIELSSTISLAPNKRRWAAQQLVDHALWDVLPAGWHIHDFEVHNRTSTREFVEREREQWRERQRVARANVTPLHRYE